MIFIKQSSDSILGQNHKNRFLFSTLDSILSHVLPLYWENIILNNSDFRALDSHSIENAFPASKSSPPLGCSILILFDSLTIENTFDIEIILFVLLTILIRHLSYKSSR